MTYALVKAATTIHNWLPVYFGVIITILKSSHDVEWYTVHSPNDQSPNDQSLNDHSPNDQSPNDQSSEHLKCDQFPNADISRTNILRMTNLRIYYQKYASFSIGYYTSVCYPDQRGWETFKNTIGPFHVKGASLVLKKLNFTMKG
jgi:hypothetical protein